MTTQEIWQLQALEAPRVSATYMRHRARDLARRTQIRKGAKYAIGVPGVLYIAWVDSLSFYRRELERQRDARRGNWRRSLPLVVPGLITVLASFVLELNPTPWALVAFEAISIVGGLSLTAAFEERSARRLQQEIDALDSLIVKDPAR